MSYQFDPERMYRMPIQFGPSLGPRQGRNAAKYANDVSPKKTVVSVSYLSESEKIESLLPPGFSVCGEPVVTISASYVTEIEWLAGRGYNMLAVTFPARFDGERDRVEGRFLAVLWENLADPIITGREELGFSKVYCELPELQVMDGMFRGNASWMGFQFLEIAVTNAELVTSVSLQTPAVPNLLHYKYVPKTGDWGQADANYATMSPEPEAGATVKAMWQGDGHILFRRATWEQLPTLFHIVNALEALPVLEYRDATVVKTVGGRDYNDQRILH